MYKFSEKSINFVRNNLILKNIFSLPINEDNIEEIIDYAVNHFEVGLLDESEKPIPGFEILQKDGEEFVDEYSLHCEEIDYVDLNKRLK